MSPAAAAPPARDDPSHRTCHTPRPTHAGLVFFPYPQSGEVWLGCACHEHVGYLTAALHRFTAVNRRWKFSAGEGELFNARARRRAVGGGDLPRDDLPR